MASSETVKLYRSPALPDHWVGHDKHEALVQWPIKEDGWDERTPYTGGKRQLEEVEPALARGTGWPGAGGGRPPRAPSGKPSGQISIRCTEDEQTSWREAAGPRTLTEWARDELNEAAARKRARRS